MNGVDLSIEYPALSTERFEVAEAPPEGFPIRGGIVADIPISPVPTGTIRVTTTVRGWGARWDRAPDFTATVWNADFDVGYRFEGPSEALVSGWWGIGSGLHFGLLAVDYWEDVLTVGIGGFTGGGIVFGRGDLRGTLSVRASATLDVDSWSGTVAAHETTTWTYWPGSARVAVLGGVAFR